MSRILLTAAFILSATVLAAADTKAYTLSIGGRDYQIDAGDSVEVDLPDGKKATVKLERNPFARYAGESFAFEHPAGTTVGRSEIDKTIDQHLLATALGTLIILQEYRTLDPTSLDQLMLQQLTQDGIRAGAKVSQQPATRTLSDGKQLKGLTASETSRTETIDYEIVSYGEEDRGVLVVTRIDQDNNAADGEILKRFWETLKIGF